MNGQVQPATGYQLGTAGTANQDEEGTPLPQSFGTSILSWLQGGNAFGSTLHSIGAYQTAFNRLNAASVPPIYPVSRARAPVEQPTRLRPPQERQYLMQAIQQVRADAASPTGTVATYQVPAKIPGSTTMYKRHRTSAGWVVTFGDDIVCTAEGKKEAGRLARQFNRAARR